MVAAVLKMPSKARSKGKCKRSAATNPTGTLSWDQRCWRAPASIFCERSIPTTRPLGRASTNSAVRRPVPHPASSTASSPRNRNRDNTFLPQLSCGPDRRWYTEEFHSREADGGCSANARFRPAKTTTFQTASRNRSKSVERGGERPSTRPPAHDRDHRQCPRHPRCPLRYAPCHR
jgi:hypothetical protein